MAAVFLPIAAAIELGLDPLTLILPVALAASPGFMLPIAIPPNAIVFGSGEMIAGQMLQAGWILDIVSILIAFGVALFIAP